ncbi:MAG: type II toxin-antitoxin system RelE/ParE family toxin [Candidatus Blackburnbacteria bacterium]|nr:type II toxin-antitoxin system RelE/ParE family toxin [Candidatus Blackburnbacteria bacterium]
MVEESVKIIWEIIFFESSRGERIVENFILAQQDITQAKIGNEIDLLEKHGPFLGMPHSKKLNSQLYELRIRGKQEVRIIYAFMGKKIYLLHAFRKQTQKTPAKELVIAQHRLNLLLTP